MHAYLTYEDTRHMVCTHAWEILTHNGCGMDNDERDQTMKTVRDVATNTYREGIADVHWLAAIVAKLTGKL